MSRIKAKQISDINATITSVINATSINALSDVDTSTAAPTNGQVLNWNGTNWVPNNIQTSSAAVVFHANVTTSSTLTLTQPETVVLFKNGSTEINVSLPLILNKNGYKVHLKRLGTANVTINVHASDTGKYIDFSGTTSFILASTGTCLTLIANETDGAWYIV